MRNAHRRPLAAACAAVLAFIAFLAFLAPVAATAAISPPVDGPVAFAALPLDRAQSLAVEYSPDVEAANAIVDESRAALSAARSAIGPAVVGGYNLAPQAGPGSTTISTRIASVGVQSTFGDVLAYAPAIAAASASLRSAEASYAAAVRAERAKTIGLYFDALRARAIAQARAASYGLAQEQDRAARLRFGAGDAPKLDVLRTDVALARARASLDLANAADENAASALSAETGGAVSLARTSVAAPAAVELPALADAVTAATAQSPELRAADEAARAARAGGAVARTAIFPPVTLAAGYARGIDSGVAVAGPTVNLSVTVPLGGGAFAKARQQDALARELAARARAVRRTIALDVAASVRNLDAALRAQRATEEARASAAAELQATELGYGNGATSSLELSTARDTYTQALVDALGARYDVQKARAILHLEVAS